MEKRRGASISVKMIATSTLLILMIVALYGILNIVNTSRVFDVMYGRGEDPAFIQFTSGSTSRLSRRSVGSIRWTAS